MVIGLSLQDRAMETVPAQLKQEELTDEVEPLLTYLYSPKTKNAQPIPRFFPLPRYGFRSVDFVYNKTINDKGDLHYYNHRRPSTCARVEDREGHRRRQINYADLRKFEFTEDEDERMRNKPEISISRSFPSQFIPKVGDEVEMTLYLRIREKQRQDLKFLSKDPTAFHLPKRGQEEESIFVPKPEEEDLEEFPPKFLEAGNNKRTFKLEAQKVEFSNSTRSF